MISRWMIKEDLIADNKSVCCVPERRSTFQSNLIMWTQLCFYKIGQEDEMIITV